MRSFPPRSVAVLLLALAAVSVGAGAVVRPAAKAQTPEPTVADNDGSGDVSAGDSLTYVITGTNSGPVTLTNVVVSDALSGDVATCATVASGGTCVLVVTYLVTPADVAAGVISTTATADSDQIGPVPLDAPASIAVPRPGLSINKQAPVNTDSDRSGSISQGDTLTYTITATNAGTANLTGVTVSDAMVTRTGGTAPCSLVPPGGTCTLIGSHVVTAADVSAGQVANVATADSVQSAPVQDSQTVSVAAAPSPTATPTNTPTAESTTTATATATPPPTPTATPPPEVAAVEIVIPGVTTIGAFQGGVDVTARAGDDANYSLTIANTGDVPLADVVANDDAGGITNCLIVTLLPDQTDDSTCAGSIVLTQDDIDAGQVQVEAFVTAQGPGGIEVGDSATITLTVPQEPALGIAKTAMLDPGADGVATPGDIISYAFVVENGGNVTLAEVTVSDAGAGVPGCVLGTLPPGGTNATTCSGSYALTQPDIDHGHVGSQAAVTGVYAGGIVTATSSDDGSGGLSVPQEPALTVDRLLVTNADEDGSSSLSLGDSLTFAVTATNAGNVTLTNVRVGEDLTADETGCTSLAPDTACTLEVSFSVGRANVDAGGVPNLAYASSDQTGVVRPTGQPFDEVAGIRIEPPSNFLSEFPGLSGVSTDLGVAGTNLGLALLAIVTLLAATTVFNSTLEENATDIDAAVRRVSGSPQAAPVLAALGWISAEQAGGEHRLVHWLKPLAIVLITALIYAVLEPDFGLNRQTVVVATSLFAGIAVVTFLYEGGQVLWSSRHYHTPAAMRLFPLAIVIALGCVALTRLTSLHPGIIFGFVTAAAIFPIGETSRRQRGLTIAAPLIALMCLSAVAFLLIDPLHDFSEDNPSVWSTLPETIAVAVFVAGAQSALLILIPVTFNDGEHIWGWNRLVWFALAIPAAFAFIHVILNDDDFGQLREDTNAVAVMAICVALLCVALGTWLFFRLRRR